MALGGGLQWLLVPATGCGPWGADRLVRRPAAGSVVGAIGAGAVQDDLARVQSTGYLLSLIAFGFLWYFAIAFVVLEIVRAFARKP